MISTETFKLKKLFTVTFIFINLLFLNLEVSAQQLEIKIKSLPQSVISVEGKVLNKSLYGKNLAFLENYADVSNLGSRIGNLKVFDEKGNEIQSKKISAGEFQSDQIYASWKYEVKSAVSQNITDSAHISWISENEGLVMLNDLLPKFADKTISAKVSFDFQKDWRVATGETRVSENIFDVKNIENAVFLFGKNWREKSFQLGKTSVNFAVSGDWAFSDEEASEMMNSIFAEHKKVFGDIPNGKPQIILLPFPQADVSADRWRAETRGATVTIITEKIPQKNAALQRLHEQLRHEIFHFWIPNALNLSGDYAWFYEGFSIYQALRTGVLLNQIRFEDYLNTLSNAYRIVNNDAQGQTISLLEASQKRWAGANNYIYAKGLLVAFLCDVVLLSESKGKREIRDIFRAVYLKHKFPAENQDGNAAILSILKSYPALIPVAENYIEGKSAIVRQEYLDSAGIEFENNQLKVKDKLNSRQKDLLDDLGYNQWRKLLQKKK